MAIFKKESLNTLRQKIDLVEVLSSHLELKRTGAAYKGLCPFHDEKTPSFVIQKGDTFYHCFGCGAHGDAIQFLMTHLKMSFSDAVESLAQKFQVHLERVEGSEEPKGPNKSRLKEALDAAARFYQFILLHTQEGHYALHYLYQRGLDLDFIHQFQLGLAPKTSGHFRKIMYDKGFNDDILIHAGLLATTQSNGLRDFFSDRITFPIHNASGAIIGFSARKYKEETFGGKYINTSETSLFKKSRVLFGLNYSRRRIAKERKAIIVEGQIDALRLIQVGFNITVAGQGTAFGEEHAKELLNLGVQCVYLALDADTAGQEASRKIGNLFQKEGVEVRVIQLPQDNDPDLFLREKGPEAFIKLMQDSIDYLTFLVNHEGRQLNVESPAGKNELVYKISQQIRTWDNPLMVHESLRKLAHLTHVPESIVGVGQDYLPSHVYIKKTASIGVQLIDPDRILESDLLRWLLLMGDSHPQFVHLVRYNIKPEDLHVNVCQQMYQTYIESDEQKACDLWTLANRLDDAEGQLFLSDLLQKKVNKERAEQQLRETIQRILDRNWMEKREEIRMKIQSGRCSDEEADELAHQFDALKRNAPKVQELP